MSEITPRERRDLIALCKQRVRLAKDMAAQRAADLLADFEAQLASAYSWDDDEAWSKAHRLADDALAEANRMIAERCGELGIPHQFAPRLEHWWLRRGENASKQRREELRKVAVTRLDAMKKGAQVSIDRAALEVQTLLVAEGLETDAAQRFLETGMPTVESLMPRLAVPEVEKLLGPGGGEKGLF